MRMALKDEQTGKNKHFINSLEFAWQGIKTVFREERNMRKHVAFGVTAIVFGLRIFTFIQSGKRLKTWPQELFY